MSIFLETLGAGQKYHLEVDRILAKERSLYQTVALYTSKIFERVLTLDHKLILAEVEAKQLGELLGMIPVMLHPAPANVCLIGGCWGAIGDSIHRSGRVRALNQIEIDDVLVDLMVSHWPQTPAIATGAQLQIQDPIDALNASKSPFDVIIIEKKSMWTRAPFEQIIQSADAALNNTGLVVINLGSPYENPAQFSNERAVLQKAFSQVFAFAIHTPTQAGGMSLAFLCSNWCSPGLTARSQQAIKALPVAPQWYCAKTHAASFILAEYFSNTP